MTRPHSLFVLGGARSGKSRYAQTRAEALDGDLVYIATAQAYDREMRDRIARHRADRGPRWHTVEAPIDLPEAITAEARAGQVVLVDCLTLWASNLLLGEFDHQAALDRLLAALGEARAPVILVANEVGLGIVPDNALARAFRDMAGTINQAVAAVADEACFIAAGLPMRLK